MKLLNDLRNAFSHRARPSVFCESERSVQESNTVEDFVQALEKESDTTLLQKHHDAIYWLTPEAFCYFLPRLIEISINEKAYDLLALDGIISMLDRSPSKEYWDNFFLLRWKLLTSKECESLQEWILWLLETGGCYGDVGTLDRAYDTLALLKSNQKYD